jgi:ubiquinol-cytochrome c reductase iron-sulfur subunit
MTVDHPSPTDPHEPSVPAPDRSRRQPSGASIGLAFGLSTLSSIGLFVVYALGGQPQIEGALIGVSLGGLAYGFVMWAKLFMPTGGSVQEREPLASSSAERETFFDDFFRGAERIGRRKFLARMLVGALGALGLAALLPIRSLGPNPGRSLFNTAWRAGSRVVTEEGTPVRATDLDLGGVLTVFPENAPGVADSQTVLIRVDETEFHPLPGRADWAPQGNVAYSKICTHAGCPVGLYEQSSGRLFCPCHQSVFDVLDGAEPIGGPATRPLPQLPLAVAAQVFRRARSDFTDPVGPGFWNRA